MKKKSKNKVFIIAEAGVNHNGDINKAIKLVDIAKKAGADAVKFQLFDINEQISPIAKNAKYQLNATGEKNMAKMAQDYFLPWEEHIKIKKYCTKVGIEYLSSCCDKKAENFLVHKLKCNLIKISSGEITNHLLLKHIAKKNKKIILSTGMSDLKEIKKAVYLFKDKSKLSLLHCISNYPAKDEVQNLNIINLLKKKFNLPIGFSDHTKGNISAIIAVTLGSQIIEKHFTINKNLKGPDHSMSLNPKELRDYVNKIRQTEEILGEKREEKIISKEELIMRKIARRGIISIKDIEKGEKLTNKNIAIKRPMVGIDASKFEKVLNKTSKTKIKKNTPIYETMIIN